MGSVEFQEDNFRPFERPVPQAGGLIGLLLRSGFAKDAQSAQVILLGIFFLAMGTTGFLLFTGGEDKVKLPPPPPTYRGASF